MTSGLKTILLLSAWIRYRYTIISYLYINSIIEVKKKINTDQKEMFKYYIIIFTKIIDPPPMHCTLFVKEYFITYPLLSYFLI